MIVRDKKLVIKNKTKYNINTQITFYYSYVYIHKSNKNIIKIAHLVIPEINDSMYKCTSSPLN